MQQFKLAFGEKELTIDFRDNQPVEVVEGNFAPAITDVEAAVKTALQNPIGTPPLSKVVAAGDKVAVIVSDVTRQWVRHNLFLPVLLDELNEAGVPDSNIQLVVALGAHRVHSDAENIQNYGQRVLDRVSLIQSSALNEADFKKIGTTSRGVDVCINKNVLAADKVILTGGIVYHSMAGFGGGRKSILPGVSGYQSIQGNHRFCLSPVEGQGLNPNSAPGNLATNDMHLDMTEMAEMVNPDFLFNVVLNPAGELAAFFAGHWYKAWEAGCHEVEKIYGVSVKDQADLVLVSAGGFPKDINFYQATKAIENAFAAVKDDGVMIAVMELRDIAEPPDFSQWFDYESLQDREMALRDGFTVPGFVALKTGYLAKEKTMIVVTLPENAAFIEKAGLTAVSSIEEALALAKKKLGRDDYRVMVLPHGATTLPLLTK